MLKKLVRHVSFGQSGQTAVAYGCGAAAVIAVVGILLVLFSGANVSPGYVGVVSTAGSGIDVNQQPLGQGFHPVVPFVTHIDSVSIQPQNHQFSEVGTASKELQNVYVDGGINYQIDPNQAARLVLNGGVDNIVNRVFNPAFQDYIKEIVPQYSTEEILPHRSDIRDAVKTRLAQKAVVYGITVTDVFLTNIHFDKDYTAAIEAKQVAQQQLEQAKIQAQTAVTTAQGQADANAKLNASLTPTLIQWQQLQIQLQIQLAEIAKWDGKLPQVTGGGSPFITLTRPTAQ